MMTFTENISNALLSEEWLSKVDSKSTPYLLKFGATKDENVCVLITDTKTVWSEVLSSKQVLRRWRDCNPTFPISHGKESIAGLMTLMSVAHTTGAFSDASFEIVDSPEADLAFEVEFDAGFKWRWDAYLLGPKTSADVLSRHLIMPLISVVHISFYSADPVSELEEGELEKLVDKIGRTARRSVGIHLRQTLARPRIATTIRRVSSLFGFASTPTPIKSDADSPDLDEYLAALKAALQPVSLPQRTSPPPPVLVPEPLNNDVPMREVPPQRRSSSTLQGSIRGQEHTQKSSGVNTQALIAPTADQDESATESDDEPDMLPSPKPASQSRLPPQTSSQPSGVSSKGNVQAVLRSAAGHAILDSDSNSSPPTKKVKGMTVKSTRDSNLDSDSDGPETRNQSPNSRLRAPAGRGNGTNITRSVRQPIKRGAKRF